MMKLYRDQFPEDEQRERERREVEEWRAAREAPLKALEQQLVEAQGQLGRVLRIVNGVVGLRACDQEARTPANPTTDTFHEGWSTCAGLVRSRLRQAGYQLGDGDAPEVKG